MSVTCMWLMSTRIFPPTRVSPRKYKWLSLSDIVPSWWPRRFHFVPRQTTVEREVSTETARGLKSAVVPSVLEAITSGFRSVAGCVKGCPKSMAQPRVMRIEIGMVLFMAVDVSSEDDVSLTDVHPTFGTKDEDAAE